MAGGAVLDDPARMNGSPASRGGERRGVGHDRIVHQVRDRPAAVAVQPVREDAEHERLEVVLQEAADDVGVAELGPQQQARRLERARGEDHVVGRDLVLDELVVEVPHAARAAGRTRRAARR